jgi:hypothetical protein
MIAGGEVVHAAGHGTAGGERSMTADAREFDGSGHRIVAKETAMLISIRSLPC